MSLFAKHLIIILLILTELSVFISTAKSQRRKQTTTTAAPTTTTNKPKTKTKQSSTDCAQKLETCSRKYQVAMSNFNRLDGDQVFYENEYTTELSTFLPLETEIFDLRAAICNSRCDEPEDRTPCFKNLLKSLDVIKPAKINQDLDYYCKELFSECRKTLKENLSGVRHLKQNVEKLKSEIEKIKKKIKEYKQEKVTLQEMLEYVESSKPVRPPLNK